MKNLPPQKTSSRRLLKTALLLSSLSALQICIPANAQLDPYMEGVGQEVREVIERSAKLHQGKDISASEKLLSDLLAKLEKEKHPKSAELALVTGDIAYLYKDTQPAKAIPYARSLVEIDKKRWGPRSPFIAEDTRLLADCYFSAKQFESAAKAYQDSLNWAIAADESMYCPCIVAATVNRDRKKSLILSCYEGIAKSNLQPDMDDTADAFFSSAIADTMKAADSDYRQARARILFKYYRAYLAKTNQPDKAAKVEDDIKSYEREIQANRNWAADGLAQD